jgi:hypothetical protein
VNTGTKDKIRLLIKENNGLDQSKVGTIFGMVQGA